MELGSEPQQALPPVVANQRVSWSCKRKPSALQVRRGIPASIALFSGDQAWVTLDIPARSARNPLQPYFFPHTSGVPRRGCRARVVSGRIANVDPFYGVLVLSPHHRLSIAADTQLRTPAVDGVPRLTNGLSVKVHALACHGRKLLVARSIAAS